MKPLLVVVAAMLCAASFEGAPPADVPLKPGRYVITQSIEMNGQRAGEPAKSSPRCLTAADMKDVENVFSPYSYMALGRNARCQVTNLSVSGGTFIYDLECPRSTDHVQVTVSGDSFRETRSAKGKTSTAVSMMTKVDGTRVGECRK